MTLVRLLCFVLSINNVDLVKGLPYTKPIDVVGGHRDLHLVPDVGR